jgi:hypothetical protein
MTIDGPRRAAFNTTEILEKILRYLPNRTIFGVQRVCRQWKDTINGSPTIQDKLFIRLRGKTPETWILTNPTSFDQFHSADFDIRSVEKNFRVPTAAEMKLAEEKVQVNFERVPLFMPMTLNPLLSWWDVAGQLIEEDPVEHAARHTAGANFTHFAKHGSSRATFISDPPCKEIKVSMHFGPRPLVLGSTFWHATSNSDQMSLSLLGMLSIGHWSQNGCGGGRPTSTIVPKSWETVLQQRRSLSWKGNTIAEL